MSPRRQKAVYAWSLGLGLASLAAAVLTSRASDWQPLGLVILLAATAVVSDLATISIQKGLGVSASFLALVVAMVLLGPAPACAIGLFCSAAWVARSPRVWRHRITDVPVYMAFPIVGGLCARLAGADTASGVTLGLIVLGIFAVTNALNFVLVAATVDDGFMYLVREWLAPALPAQLPTALVAAALTIAYRSMGLSSVLALFIVLLVFQVLTREMVQSKRRSVELEARTTQLASLQVGVLATLVQTLSLRDKMTARHSAAVSRYAKAIAEEIGCTPEEQELVHTAGLLHDIGKFAFPDSILFANRRLSSEDWEIVKRHPSQGARLVQRVDGYGPVAAIILAHHERVDGNGYPHGLAGDEIPILARMISVADTYDVMTARDSYRKPVSRSEAVAELRRVSGTQLDGNLVEVFIRLLARRGLMFQHTTDADFEAELAFSDRVRALGNTRAA